MSRSDVAKSVKSSFVGTAVSMGAMFLCNFLLARALDTRSLGTYFLVFSVSSSVGSVAQLGLARSGLVMVAGAIGRGELPQARAALERVLALGVLSSVGLPFAFAAGARFIFSDWLSASLLMLVGTWAFAMALQKICSELFRGLGYYYGASLLEGVLTNSAYAAGTLLLSYYHVDDVIQFLFCSVASSVLVSLTATAILCAASCRLSSSTESPLPWKSIFSASVPQLLGSMAASVVGQAPILVLSGTRGLVDVALYGAADRIVKVAMIPMSLLQLSIAATAASLYSQRRTEALQGIVTRYSNICGLISLALLLPLAAFSGRILLLIFGPTYMISKVTMLVLLIASFVAIAAGPGDVLLQASGNQKAYMLSTMMTAISVLTFSAIGAFWGLVGVATAVGIVNIVRCWATATVVWRRVGIRCNVSLELSKWRAMLRGAPSQRLR